MAGWQDELADLLRELGVTPEESGVHTPTARRTAGLRLPNASIEALILQDIAAAAEEDEELELWITDLDDMRREVDSIVRQVVSLIQSGNFNPSFKDDVMMVLRALRRRATVTRQASASEEATLESVKAMLHFCRLILRLSETSPGEENKLP